MSLLWLVVNVAVFGTLALITLCRLCADYNRSRISPATAPSIAFLHPFCSGGGGGERVLWDAISFMLQNRDQLGFSRIIIYASDDTKTLTTVLRKVESRFDIQISKQNQKLLSLVPLKSHFVIASKYHPFATLLLQSLSAIILAVEGLFKFTPHIFIDTTGFAFTYPVASVLFGCKVVSYTHYPTISNDMLHRVSSGKAMYNNASPFTQSGWKKQCKLWYYRLFAVCYGICGYFASVVMVNSTWTRNHIESLFYRSSSSSTLSTVYPPCGNSEILSKFELKNRKRVILSVGQFRPEKNHQLQIEAFAQFRKRCKTESAANVKLVMVGGVRDMEDRRRVNKLRAFIGKYGLRECVEIKTDLEWGKLLKLFEQCFVGLHTMEDEHFGICLAEYMCAGMVTIGHCSGGPLSDIVECIHHKSEVDGGMLQSERGFLCTTKEQYAKCFQTVFEGFDDGNGWMEMRQNARKWCLDKFSCRTFQEAFVSNLTPVLPQGSTFEKEQSTDSSVEDSDSSSDVPKVNKKEQ